MRRRGFTLVELLVVIGIIAVLIAILLPALNAARRQAKRIKAASDVRQMLIAYSAYHTDNKGWLLFGYPPQAVNGRELRAVDPVTGVSFDNATAGFMAGLIADRFPWRLVSYMPGIWPVMHGHDNLPPMTQKGDTVSATLGKAYNLSLSTGFGINAVYVGGTKSIAYPSFTISSVVLPTGTITNGTPMLGKQCVFKANEVRNAGRLIVFAESQTPSPTTGLADPSQGLPYLMPPRAAGKQFWTVEAREKIRWTDVGGFIAGLPQGRYGDRTVVGFFDNHVEAVVPSELADMRYWCDRAIAPDYNYSP